MHVAVFVNVNYNFYLIRLFQNKVAFKNWFYVELRCLFQLPFSNI